MKTNYNLLKTATTKQQTQITKTPISAAYERLSFNTRINISCKILNLYYWSSADKYLLTFITFITFITLMLFAFFLLCIFFCFLMWDMALKLHFCGWWVLKFTGRKCLHINLNMKYNSSDFLTVTNISV